MLEILASPPDTQSSQEEEQTIEQLLISLPAALREAMELGDEVAFQQAFEALSLEEQQKVEAVLEALRGQQEVVGEEQEESAGNR